MPFEIICGSCQKPMLVEAEGNIVVECPECGAHLQIESDAPPIAGVPEAGFIDSAFDFSQLGAVPPQSSKPLAPQAFMPSIPEPDAPATPELSFLSSLPAPNAPLFETFLPDQQEPGAIDTDAGKSTTSSANSNESFAQFMPPMEVSDPKNAEAGNFDFLQATPVLTKTPGDQGMFKDLPPLAVENETSVGPQKHNEPGFEFASLEVLPEQSGLSESTLDQPQITTSLAFDFVAVETRPSSPDQSPLDLGIAELADQVPAAFGEQLEPSSETITPGNSSDSLQENVAVSVIDAPTGHDLYSGELEVEHFSQSSPQLAELIRQTVGLGVMTSELATTSPASSTSEESHSKSSELVSENSISPPQFSVIETHPAEPAALDFLSINNIAAENSPTHLTNLDAQQLPSFSKVVQPFPTGDDLVSIPVPLTSGKEPAANVQEGDFHFSGQPLPVASLSPYSQEALPENNANTRKENGVSRQLFLLLAGYASATTLALVFFIVQYLRLPYHQLESLPDIKPPATGISVTLVSPDNRVAPLHTLDLNQSRRFGNIEFTPLKVIRGPIKIVHDGPDAKSETSEPVLKLLVRFKNVSQDQTIIPLDRELVFFRERKFGGRSNQFIKWSGKKAAETGVINLFELPLRDDSAVENMPLGMALAPGESIETFLPSEAGGIDELNGDLIWRVQFRKGQNLRSGHPVTTLVDVQFNADAVERETASS